MNEKITLWIHEVEADFAGWEREDGEHYGVSLHEVAKKLYGEDYADTREEIAAELLANDPNPERVREEIRRASGWICKADFERYRKYNWGVEI